MFRQLGADNALTVLGLIKTAAVPGPVKQYRRALTGLEEALRTSEQGTRPARGGFALHGTDALPDILESGRVHASKLGPTGQHGGGVYWWKGFPREEYLGGPEAEGLLTSLETLPDKKPMMSNIYSGHANPHAIRTGPGDYKLRPQDTAVVDTAKRRAAGTLAPLRGDLKEHRVREIDSAIFNQAYRDFKAKNMLSQGRQPREMPKTNQEVLGISRNRLRLGRAA